MTLRSNKENFIKSAITTHGNEYNYDNVNYISNRIVVEIICKIHGTFLQRPDNHLSGKGCIKCSGTLKMSLEQFIKKASCTHNNKYNYDLVDIKSTHKNVSIICPIHGIFSQTPQKHINGKNGCPRCVGRNTDTDFFIEKAKLIHGNNYDYNFVEYKNPTTKIIISCKLHGNFEQIPNNHLNGSGCKRCNINVSKKETAWLDSLKENNSLLRSYTIKVEGKRAFYADAYDPITNTIYEFYGDFWHGNPKIYTSTDLNKVTNSTFGALYEKTLNKENDLKALGYNIVSIWENDWDNI